VIQTNAIKRRLLRGSTALTTLAILGTGMVATPAMAQDAANQPGTEEPNPSPAPVTNANDGSENEVITVTGSLFRRTNTETVSPVTVLSAESLQERGINTVAEAVQRVSANGAGTITQGWNTGNNFATGANAVSLRGLTVQSTLTIFDGLRMAPYPLADDGHRNFVDLNTIPNAIIERIEVLRDGASSTYGADAVAGVVNIITRRQIQGVHANASAGISQRGDAAEQRIDLTLGYGDLDTQGFNFYVNGEYQRSDPLWARDRGYPYNSSDLSGICGEANGENPLFPAGTEVCMNPAAGARNYIRNDGTFTGLQSTIVPMVRPVFDTGLPASQFRLLNEADGCRGLNAITAPANAPANVAGRVVCQQDTRAMFSQLLPEQERFGFAARATFNVGSRAQAYAMANYYQVDTFTQFGPDQFNNQTTPPGAVLFNPAFLPVYVCQNAVVDLVNDPGLLNTGCNAANGQLNPNNPFADVGLRAQLVGQYDRARTIESSARSLRGVIGVSGSFGNEASPWNYTVDFTASNVQLDITQSNYLIPQRLATAIARGTYNFVNPELNSQEVRDFISPQNETRSTSDLWQATATLGRELFDLPGGPLQVAVGVAYRHESINNPSANPANDEHPFDRYYGINAVGAIGSRDVRSAYYEINAPILDQLELSFSGRYDDYSSGQTNFSPKVGVKFTPIPQVALRGTYSRGFRIPSFNEAFGLPTTGYVTEQLDITNPDYAAFFIAHSTDGTVGGANAYATGPFGVGQTTTGNPSLDPEKSRSFTLGAIFEPIRNVSFTIDYWNIEINGIIGAADDTGVLDEYYKNNGVVNRPGITVVPGLPDVNFPNALPHIGFIESSFQNADSQNVSGIDLGASIRLPVGPVRWTSSLEASYLIKFTRTTENGITQRYDGTLSPCDVTSCSGAPKWRGSWQNTFEIGNTTLSATAYYTSGYDLAAVDSDEVRGECGHVRYEDGTTPVRCNGPETWNVDFTASQRIDDRLTLYVNVLNVLDIDAPFDPAAAYSTTQYNPAWAGANIMGRYFRVGARVDF